MTGTTLVLVGGLLALLGGFLGLGYWLAKKKGTLEAKLEQANVESTAKDRLLDAMANPADKSGTVDKLQSGEF